MYRHCSSDLCPVRNRILARLPAEAFGRLRPSLTRVRLHRHQILQDAYRQIDDVHFIEEGVAVILARTQQDGRVEVGVIGRLGFVGVPVALGTMSSPHRCVVQVDGEALRIAAHDLAVAMAEIPSLRQALLSYVQALIVQNAQLVLCNARHTIQQRLARWLLSVGDRLDDSAIPLTHDALSMMLGVRRVGITRALGELERSGALRRRRGMLEIRDVAVLQRISCECYRVIAREYERLLNRDPEQQDYEAAAVSAGLWPRDRDLDARTSSESRAKLDA